MSPTPSPPTHPVMHRLAITAVAVLSFVVVALVVLGPLLYNARIYSGYYFVASAIVRGDLIRAKASLQRLYSWRGVLYVVGALVYGGTLLYDMYGGARASESALPDARRWTVTHVVEMAVAGALLVYGGVLLWYGVYG